jgi:hypothetical protein
MTPAEQAALEALVGRPLTSTEVEQIDPMLAPVRQSASIAALLSVGRVRLKAPHLVSARGFSASYPGGPISGEVVLMKLEGAAAVMKASADQQQKVVGSLLARQLAFFNTDAGLDFGDTTLRGMIDQFAQMGLITADEASKMKAIAMQPAPLQGWQVDRALTGDATGEVIVLAGDQLCVGDSRFRVAVGGDYSPDALVACYRNGDETKQAQSAFSALFVARGETQ